MYTLYWEAISGAIGPQAALEEIGADYTPEHVDMGAGAHRQAPYREICPTMRVPALKLPEGDVIGETTAILLTLAERHPDAGLFPAPGDADRPDALYWLTAMASGGYPVFSRSWHPEQFTDDPDGEPGIKRVADATLEEVFDIFEGAISGYPWFLARGFTVLDIYLAMMIEWMPDREAFYATRPRTRLLVESVRGRPSWRRVADDHELMLPGSEARLSSVS